MTRNELVKMAYAYGASVALQEAGYNPAEAETAGIKLAEEADAAPPQEEGTLDMLAKRQLKDKIMQEKSRVPLALGTLSGVGTGAGLGALLGKRFGGGMEGAGLGASLGGYGGALLGLGGGALYSHLRHGGKAKQEAATAWDQMREGKHKGIAPLNITDM